MSYEDDIIYFHSFRINRLADNRLEEVWLDLHVINSLFAKLEMDIAFDCMKNKNSAELMIYQWDLSSNVGIS